MSFVGYLETSSGRGGEDYRHRLPWMETEREALMELAKKYSVTSIPAVVLVDKDGQAQGANCRRI